LRDAKDQLNSLYNLLYPIATTYKCEGAADYSNLKLKSCGCNLVNLLDCHVNATATGCDGRCLSRAKEDEVSSLDSTRADLESRYRTTQASLENYEARGALLQSALRNKDTRVNLEEAQQNLQAMTSATTILKTDLSQISTSLKTVYDALSTIQAPTGRAARCAPLLIHGPTQTVLDCGCQGPREECRPDPTRETCTQKCPAEPPISPKEGCYLRSSTRHANQPGFDAKGNYCGGECEEGGRTTTCMAVRNDDGLIRGCQCRAAEVLLQDNDGQDAPDSYCLPEEYLGNYVASCACKGSCRVGRDPFRAGQLDGGYDFEGHHCEG